MSRLLKALFSVLLSHAIIVSLPAQTPLEAAPPTLNLSPEVDVIPLAKVVPEVESTETALRNIESDVENNPALDRIQEELPAFTSEVEAFTNESLGVLQSNPSFDTLRVLENSWRFLQERLDHWKDTLSGRAQALDQHLTELSSQDKIWQKTLASLPSEGTPSNLKAHMVNLLESIKQTQTKVAARQTSVVELQGDLARQGARIRDGVATINVARSRVFDDLLSAGDVPIWKIKFSQSSLPAVATAIRFSWKDQLSDLRAYLIWQHKQVLLHLIVFTGILAFLFWIRHQVRLLEKRDQSFRLASQVLDHSAATALLLTFFMSVWFYPLAPRLLWVVIGLGALPPALIILRQTLPARLLRMLRVLVSFYLVDHLRTISSSIPVLPRLLFLLEMCGALLFLIRLFHSTPRPSATLNERDLLSSRLHLATRVAIPLVSAALLANLFGLIILSHLIGDAFLRSTYLAVGAYSLILVADGIILSLLRIYPMRMLGMVKNHHPLVRRQLNRGLEWIAFSIWIVYALELLSLLRPLLAFGQKLFLARIPLLDFSILPLAAFILAIWLATKISQLVRFILIHEVYPRLSLDTGSAYSISTILHYLILIFALVITAHIKVLQINLTQFTILISALGVGVGFGLQNIINNFVSGIILLFERPIKVGDSIQVEDAMGTVERIGIRASTLRTTNGSEIIVPNATLISNRVTNWTFSARHRIIEIPVNITSAADPTKVIELLLKVTVAHPAVTPQPAPEVLALNLAAGLGFTLRAWTLQIETWPKIRSELILQIHAALAAQNITLA